MKLKKRTYAIIMSVCMACAVFPKAEASLIQNNQTNDFSQETTDFYEQWKSQYLLKDTYVTDEDQYYVWYSGEKYSDNQTATPVTVSEAHGYGMLITASMADYDSQAKDIFDGMYNYYKAHLSEIGPHLMAWQQSDNGKKLVDSDGANSATDGDMDIAYALLMADSIWGSDGEINYKQAGIDIINDIMEYEVNKTDWVIKLGDWTYWTKDGEKYNADTRASDFIMQYLPVYAEFTGDDRWLNVYESTYNIINDMVDKYGTGLIPDFIIKDKTTGEFVPAPANYLEGDSDGSYSYNSCRIPWRISMDYLINGNTDAKAFADAINSFITKSAENNPENIMAGYKLDGTPTEDYNDLCFTAPFLISAGCGDNMEWHDALRDEIVNYGEDVYYGDTIKMLCLIADDGCWIVPKVTDNNTADNLTALKKWILYSENLPDWEKDDFNKDNSLNVYDVCLMKKAELTTEK